MGGWVIRQATHHFPPPTNHTKKKHSKPRRTPHVAALQRPNHVLLVLHPTALPPRLAAPGPVVVPVVEAAALVEEEDVGGVRHLAHEAGLLVV